jgi:hypothetical protein
MITRDYLMSMWISQVQILSPRPAFSLARGNFVKINSVVCHKRAIWLAQV